MKILMVIPYFIPAWSYGGPIQVCYLQSKYLVKKGHSVTVVTTDTFDSNSRIEKKNETIDGINIIRFRNLSNSLAKKANGYLPLNFYTWLDKHICEFDVIHCHDFFTYQNICVHSLAKKHKKKYVLQPHGSAVPFKSRGKVGIKSIFNKLFGENLIGDAAYTICLTTEEKKTIKEYFPKTNPILFPNMVESIPKLKINNIRAKYKIPADAIVILSLGRLHYVKGFDILIQAFNTYHSQKSNSYLIIAGPDEGELSALKTLTYQLGLASHILFPGLVTGSIKTSLFKSADIFALLSRNEPFPVSALEALESGLPLLLSSNVGIAGEISQNGLGVSVGIENVNNISKAISQTLDLRSKEFKSKAKAYLSTFRPQKQISKLINLYQR